ncbi:hypothetical protein [Vibrio sp. TRT 29B02]|uniref:hypothetical protein n=1 Tax=unclassified Vibrio TaxID=2614977 RepID=UPI003CF21C3D
MKNAFQIKGIYPKLLLMMMSGATIPLVSIFINDGRYDVLIIAIFCLFGFMQKYTRLMFKTDRGYRGRVIAILVISAVGCIVIPEFIVLVIALPCMFYVSLKALESYASNTIDR